jgi:hypothetical protein
VVSALASDPEALGNAADSSALLLATTANRQAELAESTRALGPALADARVLLDRLAAATPNLREFVSEARPAVTELQPLVRLLPDATDATGPFLEQTKKLVKSGPSDLKSFRPIIQAATPVTQQLLDVTEAGVGPLGEELRVYAPETIGAFQNFGAATGSFDAVGHILTTAAGNGQNGLPPSTLLGGQIDKNACGPDGGPAPGQVELPFVRSPGALGCDPWEDYEDSFIDASGDEVR